MYKNIKGSFYKVFTAAILVYIVKCSIPPPKGSPIMPTMVMSNKPEKKNRYKRPPFIVH